MIIGLDIETTGLEWEKGHKIIEFCAKSYDESGKEADILTVRINPMRPIDPKAFAVHHISFDDVADEQELSAVAPEILRFLDAATLLVAHNGSTFDIPFIQHELRQLGLALPTVPMVDTCNDGRWATPMGKLPNLRELCFACGVDYDTDKAHAADYDVEVMMAAFFNARKKGFFKSA